MLRTERRSVAPGLTQIKGTSSVTYKIFYQLARRVPAKRFVFRVYLPYIMRENLWRFFELITPVNSLPIELTLTVKLSKNYR